MATRKKTRKAPARKPLKPKAATKKPKARPKPKPKPKKRPARKPPMHARPSRAQLIDAAPGHSETFEIFKSFDRDGSGSIDRAELARLLEALGQPVTEEELAVALEVIDVNHSGRISWEEFRAWWSAP